MYKTDAKRQIKLMNENKFIHRKQVYTVICSED